MPPAKLIVISAPSGGGKTTIAQELMRRHPGLRFSVSATTRPKRPQEVHGKDYFFLAPEEFHQKVGRGELVEWEQIYNDYYGTLKSEVEKALREGIPMLFDIDVKGALTIKKKYPDAVLIFLMPPSMAILKKRLLNRKTETAESLKKRLGRVPMELEQERLFDHSVVNDEVSRAVEEIEGIVGLKAK